MGQSGTSVKGRLLPFVGIMNERTTAYGFWLLKSDGPLSANSSLPDA